uniref:Uncharacterized protein n=1 Tax=Ciona intestinalis TaxID=7719 RepID=H2XKY6_CIOIN
MQYYDASIMTTHNPSWVIINTAQLYNDHINIGVMLGVSRVAWHP